MRTRSRVAATITVIALALTGCGAPADGENADDGTLLVLSTGGDIPSWDPSEMKEGDVLHFGEAVYDPLLRKTEDSEIEGNLAETFEYNEDSTELTLELRDGVTFSDGTTLDAEVVKANIEARKTGSGSASEAAKVISEIEVVDDSTVRLMLTEPSPAMLAALSTYLGFMASGDAVAAGTLGSEPIGSGPYVLNSGDSESAVEYKFDAREDYWNREAFPFDSLAIRPYEDFSARYNALATGQIDFMYATPDLVPQAEEDKLVVQTVPGEWQGLVIQDRAGTITPELKDARVRQAINLALDRETIVETHYAGLGIPSAQTFNPSSEAWSDDLNMKYPYDPEQAKKLLAEAGFGDGFVLPIAYPEGFLTDLSTIVTQYLADVNITVEPIPATGGSAEQLRTLKEAPVFMLSFSTNIPAWTDVLNKVTPEATWNNFGYTDETVERLIKEIPAAKDEERKDLYIELNTHLVDEAWFAPVATLDNVYLSSTKIDVTMQQAQLIPSLRRFTPAS